MAFEVEDGSGLAGANSYLSVDAADDYWADRANAVWAAKTEPEKKAALIKATDYLVRRYRGQWKGSRTTTAQALDWPRAGVENEECVTLPSNAVPGEVAAATAELAYRALTETLMPDLARGGKIKEQTVGPITTVFMDGAPAVTSYQAVDGLLGPLLECTGGVGRLVRN